jgi:hypothetical protein
MCYMRLPAAAMMVAWLLVGLIAASAALGGAIRIHSRGCTRQIIQNSPLFDS